jgi:malate permease and related proteins
MRTFALAAGTQNFGFTAVPVVEILWSTGTLAMLFVHNIGVELAMWSVGVMVMSGSAASVAALLNGPVVAVVSDCCLVALGLGQNHRGAAQGDVDDRRGLGPARRADHRLHDRGSGGAEKPTRENHFRFLAGAAGAGPAAFLIAAKFLPIATELRRCWWCRRPCPRR